jgi:beta-xylosidase
VLTGSVDPAGRLPLSFPGAGSSQPSSYLAAPLGLRNEVSVVDPTPLWPFGHGLSYAAASWGEASSPDPSWPTDGTVAVTLDVHNPHARAAHEVVQVYLHRPTADVALPEQRLIAAARVDLEPGQTRPVTFRLHADLTSHTGRAGTRHVVPGEVELRLAASSADVRSVVRLRLTGPARPVGIDRVLHAEVELS